MKKIINISDNLDVEYNENKFIERTVISVIRDGEKIVLSDVFGIGEDYYSDFTYNDYYIVTFSRGNTGDGGSLILHSCYSINENRVIDLTSSLNIDFKNALNNMLLTRKGFSLAHVLQVLNYNDLGLLNDDEKDELRNYLTAGNTLITDDDIAEHIVRRYPELLAYMCLKKPLTVAEYRMIEKNLKTSTFWLYAISQDLSFMDNKKRNDNCSLKLGRKK